MTADHAAQVEDAFVERLAQLAASATAEPANEHACDHVSGRHANLLLLVDQARASTRACSRFRIPRRYRNKAHLRYVAQQPCLLCGRKPSDPHHLRYMQPRALGRKASDEFSVPLCRIHHRLVHRVGNEAAWWKEAGIDPIEVARKLWGRTLRAEGREGEPPQSMSSHDPDRARSDRCRLVVAKARLHKGGRRPCSSIWRLTR